MSKGRKKVNSQVVDIREGAFGRGQVMRMGTLRSGISALIEETTESEIFCHLKIEQEAKEKSVPTRSQSSWLIRSHNCRKRMLIVYKSPYLWCFVTSSLSWSKMLGM